MTKPSVAFSKYDVHHILQKTFIITVLIFLLSAFSSCSDSSDDEPSNRSALIGTWIGSHSYNNPVGGTKTNWLYVTFNNDNTGELEYQGVTAYSIAYFRYDISGTKIKCRGAYASTDGDVDSDFNLTFEYDGSKLIPVEQYTNFILTKNGERLPEDIESEDQSNANINNVWLSETGSVVLDLSRGYYYEEYVLDGTGYYKDLTSGTFEYNYSKSLIAFTQSGSNSPMLFKVISLTANTLVIEKENGSNRLSYRKGSKSDIPTKVNYASALIGTWLSSPGNRMLSLSSTNACQMHFKYVYNSKASFGFGTGTYSIVNNNLIVNFDSLSDDNGFDLSYKIKDLTPYKSQRFTISFKDELLILTDSNGSSTKYEKYH